MGEHPKEEVGKSVTSDGRGRYERIRFLLDLSIFAVSVVGLLSNSLQANSGITLVFLIIVALIALSMVASAEARKVNWPSRIGNLMLMKTAAEAQYRITGNLSPVCRVYSDRLRDLYLVAVSEGRKDLAKELWNKGKLNKG